MKKHTIKIIVIIGFLFLLFDAYQVFFQPSYERVLPEEAKADLTTFDLSKQLVWVEAYNWAYYPGHLYTPADFEDNKTIEPEIEFSAGASAQFGTHRIVLKLPKGRAYVFYGDSFLNSQRVFINGVLVDTIGIPGESKAETTPATREYLYAFTPEADETEIIFQVANFYIADGGGRFPFIISEFANAARGYTRRVVAICLVSGSLLAAALLYAGLFTFFHRKKQFLAFSAMCVLIAIRSLVAESKLMIDIIPTLTWHTMYAIEYLGMLGLLVAYLLYINCLFPKLLWKWFLWLVFALCAVYAGLILFTEPAVYATIIPAFFVLWISCGLVIMLRLLINFIASKRKQIEDYLIYAGFLIVFAGGVNDVLRSVLSFGMLGSLFFQRSMMICAFIHMLALALGFARTEIELSDIRIRERELHETNELLNRLSATKTRFLSTISHEMKTPLTVMSLNAQLSERQLMNGEAGDTVYQNLRLISSEAKRLSGLVSGLLKVSLNVGDGTQMGEVDLGEIVCQTAELYAALLEKKGNQLRLAISGGLLRGRGNRDMLIQVLVNLLANANAHTRSGVITVTVQKTNAYITVAVSDTGGGIEPALLERVFERYEKDDPDGTGLGLPICKEIVEMHGGEIHIESECGAGTTVTWTLPIAEEGTHGARA